MTTDEVRTLLEMARSKTLVLLDTIQKDSDPMAILRWRPGPGRAHIAWQLMHIAATDDRHLCIRMKGGQAREPEYVRRFAGGSTPDDDIPTPDEIRRYLGDRRQEMLAHLASLTSSQLDTKPTPEAPWPYAEWFRVLFWHEAHHHGQAHLTMNLYKASRGNS